MSNYQPLAAAESSEVNLAQHSAGLEEDLFHGIPAATPNSNGHARSSSDSNGHTRKTSIDYPVDIQTRRRLWWRNAIIDCMFMATWFIFATSLSLYNKWMFSPTKYGFPNPLFVTMMHMFVQWGLSGLLRTLKPETFRSARTPERADYIKRAMPTGITTGMDIGLSNLSLKTVTLSFYTMCKSSTLIFVLFFAFIFKLEVFSYRLIGVMFLIFVGTLLMVATETAFNMLGMFLVIAASAAGGLRWALTQILLVGKSGKRMGMDNPASSIFWLAPTMGVTLAILSLLIEGWGDLFWGKGSKFWVSVGTTFQTLVFLISPGVLAFVMVMSEFYIIQRVGMVPMSVAGIFKEVTTISLSAWVFGDEITPVNMVGVGITFIGIGLFTHHKYLKSVHSSTPLDAHGNPILTAGDGDEAEPEEIEALEVFDAEQGTGNGYMDMGNSEHPGPQTRTALSAIGS